MLCKEKTIFDEETGQSGGTPLAVKLLVLVLAFFCFAFVTLVPMKILGIVSFAAGAEDSGYDSDGKTSSQILSEIQELYKQLNELEKKKNDLNGKISEAKESISTKLEAKNLLDEQVEAIEEQIAAYDLIIGQYDKLIAEKQKEIDELREKYDVKYKIFVERLRQSYEEGTPGTLEMIFKSESFIDFLNSVERMNDILAYDNRLMNDLENKTNVLVAERKSLESYQNDKQKVEDDLLLKKSDLDAKIDESVKYVAGLESDIDGYLGYIKQIEDDKSKLDNKILAAIEAYNSQIGKENNQDYRLTKDYKELYVLPKIKDLMESGKLQKGKEYYEDGYEYIMPIGFSAYRSGYLSSVFGWRTYRGNDGQMITSNHKGIDLAVPYRSSIYASHSGTVISAEYSSSYGNLVVILHDDGTQTRYAHASKILVRVGEYVLQGEEIALVGSTGNATGNCCHFEVRFKENSVWTAYDPLKYLTLAKS